LENLPEFASLKKQLSETTATVDNLNNELTEFEKEIKEILTQLQNENNVVKKQLSKLQQDYKSSLEVTYLSIGIAILALALSMVILFKKRS